MSLPKAYDNSVRSSSDSNISGSAAGYSTFVESPPARRTLSASARFLAIAWARIPRFDMKYSRSMFRASS